MDASSGRQIVIALKGRWQARQGMCCCPAHDDGSPSLHVTERPDGTVLLRCFGGCHQGAVIAALRERGLWPDRTVDGRLAQRKPVAVASSPAEPDEEELARMAEARSIWEASRPARGTLAETYLRNRGIFAAPPRSIRFHPGLYHPAARRELPALIGALQSPAGRVTAVQRIYLRPDGKGKAAVESPKMTRGVMGQGMVRLARPGRVLGIAEGIETAMSAMAIFSLPVWACLGASRIAGLDLPEIVEQVIIFADNGTAGMDAADRAMLGYQAQGVIVYVEPPPPEFPDFNDQLQAQQRERGIVAA